MMGPINFVHPAFRPRIVSDKPSSDGYDVANLVALENYMPPKGFLIEGFMRPPVNIYITFPCNINIAQIVLNGTVGAQKSNSFEIFTYTAARTAESCTNRWESSDEMTAKDFEKYIFSDVGKLWQENCTGIQNVVRFSNPYFQLRMPFSRLSPMPSKLFNQSTAEVQISRYRGKTLSSVSHLMVRITKTSNGGVPGLRWIEVWGQPSLSCPPEDIDRVLHVCDDIMGIKKCRSSDHNGLHPRPAETHASAEPPVKSVKIPQEFLDSVTYEIMAQPMLLPSRQSVDLSTVEKYNSEEAQYGRPPKDPFTGVPYTAYSKPIPNTALKVRIDHFLMTNSSEEINAAHRTLGRPLDMLSQKRSGHLVAQTSILLGDSSHQPQQEPSSSILQSPSTHQPHSVPQMVDLCLQPRLLDQPHDSNQPHSVSQPQSVPHPHSVLPSTSVRHIGTTVILPSKRPSFTDSLDLVLSGQHSFLNKQKTSPLTSPVSDVSPDLAVNLTLTMAMGSTGKKRPSEDPTAISLSGVKRGRRKKSSSSKGKASVIDLTCDSDQESSSSLPLGVASHTSSSVIRTNHARAAAHTRNPSLDEAIEQTLSKLPSFQNSPSPAAGSCSDGSGPGTCTLSSEWKLTKLECIYCTLKREIGMMYRLACGDVACRDCLSSRRRTGDIFCDECQKTTHTKDITKLHA